MNKMKTILYRKHKELLVKTISRVLVEKQHWCDYFLNPLPQYFSQYVTYDFAHDIANISDVTAIFL